MLRLRFEHRRGRTVLTERRSTLPLSALEPVDLDGSGAATLMLLNPTGGMVGGDVLDTAVGLGPGSRVCLTTVGATRVYRSGGAPAVERVTARLEGDAALEYLPEHVIPSPGARLHRDMRVTMDRESTLIAAESWAVGRVARGERWSFVELDAAFTVRDERGLVLRERAVLDGARRWDGLGGTEGRQYVLTFVAACPSREDWAALSDHLFAALAAAGTAGRYSVSPLHRAGLLARVLCPSAPDLRAAVDRLWTVCRSRLLGRGPLSLRKL